ncbi:MAG: tRNA (adenosine(37)-N6)-threonylcarbamoyltransferase complex dimerization subunit type 1 TsaB [Caldimonas sp.]
MTTLIAFDTATERLTIALRHGDRTWSHAGEGGAKSSATLIPAILALLREASLTLADLDAIAFGRGPGAFTGLRTACSVAQGLAFGADKPVLPIDNLLAVAEQARAGADAFRVWTVIDARMAQIYAAEYEYADGLWTVHVAPMLTDADALTRRWHDQPPSAIAGDALRVHADRLSTGAAVLAPQVTSDALSILALAEAAWHAGEAVDAALALPLYVRDKVAETTVERAARAAATLASS